MIVIDKKSVISSWIETLGECDLGFVKVDLDTFEIANGFVSEVLLIEASLFLEMSPQLRMKAERSEGIILFESNGTESSYNNLPQNCFGVVSATSDVNVSLAMLTSVEGAIKRNNLLKSELMTLNKELATALGGVETQLIRVKRAYEKKAPKRLEQFKGLKIYSKYAAGEDMGGEFFDLFSREGKIFILMSSTSSYLASSSILQSFSEFKERGVCDEEDEIKLVSGIKEEIKKINRGKKKEIHAEIMTCILDLKTFKIQGYAFGNFNILSSDVSHSRNLMNPVNGSIEDSYFELQVERGERVLFNSPGFIKSWDSLNPQFMIEELVINKKIKALDILDEVFFQLKKKSKNGFVTSDASSIILEVQDNVVHQV